MKKLKKFMAALLVALMAFAVIPAGAFAATVNWAPSAKKTLNNGTTQKFTYTVTAVATKGLGTNAAPVYKDDNGNVTLKGTGSVTVNAGETKAIDFNEITLPGDGYYEFKITEDALSGYEQVSEKTYYAIVSVIGGQVKATSYAEQPVLETVDTNVDNNTTITSEVAKVDADKVIFTNQMSEGYNIEVTKKVQGTASNPAEDSFTFTVSVDSLPDGYTADVLLNGVKIDTLTSTVKEVTVPGVKADGIISTTALPAGTRVTVTETVKGTYTSDWKDDTQTFEIQSTKTTATITNTKNAGTITGFVMHYTPYIALVVIAGVAVALIAKRRNHSEF